jgi:hypothetical protein
MFLSKEECGLEDTGTLLVDTVSLVTHRWSRIRFRAEGKARHGTAWHCSIAITI